MCLQETDDLGALIERLAVDEQAGALLFAADLNETLEGCLILVDVMVLYVGSAFLIDLADYHLAKGTGVEMEQFKFH